MQFLLQLIAGSCGREDKEKNILCKYKILPGLLAFAGLGLGKSLGLDLCADFVW